MTTYSVLERTNPTVKLVLLFAVSSAMLFVFDPFTPAMLYVVAVALVLRGTRIRPRTLAMAHLPFATFALGLLLVNLASRPFPEGMAIGTALALRTLLIGVLSIGFVVSTDPVELVTSLRHHARLGPRITYALLAGYRMLQEMPREWETIRQAQAVRRNLRDTGGLPGAPSDLARAAFTLLVVSLRRGERVAQSLESRGLGLEPRTTWQPVPLRPVDGLLALAVVTAVAGAVGLSSSLGLLEGYEVLGQ